MPWTTPTLRQTRELTRDYVLSQLGAKAMIPNSVLRIMSDAKAGLTHLTFLYLDWLAKQLLPDTAETEWLDRHGVIWLDNADGSKGRKAATYAQGTVEFVGLAGSIIPIGTILRGVNNVSYQTTTAGEIAESEVGNATAVALSAGVLGNLPSGTTVNPATPIPGVDSATCLDDMRGGVNEETDPQLRERVLFRIQNPPMGGSQADYVRWTMAVPGVTRAWAASEMGPGTITVRFLMDEMYPDNYGLPQAQDIMDVANYIDSKRPVTVMDCYVLAPLLHFYDIAIRDLKVDSSTIRARIETSIKNMELQRAEPGQPMWQSWVSEAISQAIGEESHELVYETQYMPGPGYMPALGDVMYGD